MQGIELQEKEDGKDEELLGKLIRKSPQSAKKLQTKSILHHTSKKNILQAKNSTI